MEFMTRSIELFQAGGLAMYFILICSFIVIAIFFERLMYYHSVKALPPDFSCRVDALLQEGKFEEAVRFCQESNHAAAKVAAAGAGCLLENASQRMEAVIESEASLCVARLKENINHLESIITVAPLLGLLGTVTGMMDSFKVLQVKSGEPLAITGGVGEALTATAFGLCVAIVAMGVYSFFSHRLNRMILRIEEIAAVLIRRAK